MATANAANKTNLIRQRMWRSFREDVVKNGWTIKHRDGEKGSKARYADLEPAAKSSHGVTEGATGSLLPVIEAENNQRFSIPTRADKPPVAPSCFILQQPLRRSSKKREGQRAG